MNFLTYLKVETGRIFRTRFTWCILLLTVLTPLAGYFLYKPSNTLMRSAAYIANPALAGAFGGAFLFAILALYEFDMVHRNRTAVITDSIVSPVLLNVVRMTSLIIAAIVCGIFLTILYLPYTVIVLGSVFRLSLYLKCFWFVTVPAYIIAVLAVTGIYQIVRRVDVSFLVFFIFACANLTGLMYNSFILRWINPVIPVLSDDFGNSYVLMMVLYNRIFWLLLLGGGWIFSLLCVRRYAKGLPGSLITNSKKILLPFMSVVMIAGAVYLYTGQPFIDNSPLEINYDAYNKLVYNEEIQLKKYYVHITPDIKSGQQQGVQTLQLINDSGQEQVGMISVNPGYKILKITANTKAIDYTDLEDDDLNQKQIRFTLPKDKEIELVIEYGGFPKLWSIEEIFPGQTEISKDYIFLVNQDFAPIPGFYGAEETIADITVPSDLIPVTAGDTIEVLQENKDGTTTWRSSGGGTVWHLYAAEYDVKHIEAAGAKIDFYYSAKHKAAMERVNIEDTLKEVFEYCSKHYGAFPFITEEHPFKLVELTAYMGGGFAMDGISVMDENCFSEEGLGDPLKGASGNEVMAHEIVHQWWGLGKMFPWDNESGWSSEGLTVYTTYRLMKEKYGEEYARKHYVEVWEKEVSDYYLNFYHRNPEYLDKLPETYQARIKNSKTTVMNYCEIPLKILKAEELVGGEDKMDQILAEIFRNSNQPELSYQEFLDACGLTKEDLNLD